LRRHDVEHRDLIWSNLFLQETGNASAPYTMMLIDLGAAHYLPSHQAHVNALKQANASRLRGATSVSNRKLFQPGGHPDAKLLACVFWRRLYFGVHGCHDLLSEDTQLPPQHDGTLAYALLSIMNKHADNSVEVYLPEVAGLLDAAVRV
jgi:hypothetical protein